MQPLLVEIGTEELPAGYIEPALKAFVADLMQRLAKSRVHTGEVKFFSTPRRLAVLVNDVAESQEPLQAEVTGPPAAVAFDDNGALTLAGRKFAAKVGVVEQALKVKATAKGEYVCATVAEPSQPTHSVLSQTLPAAILRMPFPKTMRWGTLDIHFARPIHWILALFGDQALSFTVGDIHSGRETFGHRFAAPAPIAIHHPDDYEPALQNAFVMPDALRRRDAVRSAAQSAAGSIGGQIKDDDELLDTVVNLVELPVVSLGTFDAPFLELPPEILITAMREHQKYFAVQDAAGALLPHFVAVNNTPARDMALVSRGHERVLRARLADARFFHHTDLKESNEGRFERLSRVLFQARLGSMQDKALRIEKVVMHLARQLEMDESGSRETAAIARWCKSDLVSQVVNEFPKLQGVMGRIFAVAAGKSEAFARAIEEHYQPVYSGAPLPASVPGAMLAVADKIDTICGCFSIGLAPTGAADPYALRRQSIGLILILRERGWRLSLRSLIDFSLSLYACDDSDAVSAAVMDFFVTRMTGLLTDEGFPRDIVAAVLHSSADNVPNVWMRAQALTRFKQEAEFEPLAAAFKRVANIIRKAEADGGREVDPGLFEHRCEAALLDHLTEKRSRVDDLIVAEKLHDALVEMAELRPSVDAFFDEVLVMAEDPAMQRNRLALLQRVADLFQGFADFSRISV